VNLVVAPWSGWLALKKNKPSLEFHRLQKIEEKVGKQAGNLSLTRIFNFIFRNTRGTKAEHTYFRFT
jgi:hypothetical protein